ncbi:methicillin resistance regulatory protein MecI [Peptococcaceae bacterium CEB3]|nr:methicillin resistance regulatory protein MecI [Peptococcaceae bacterium CEB3]
MNDAAGKISNAEWLIMKVLWEESPLTASSVVERLKSVKDWSPKTIQTLMSRLVKKGALGVNKDESLYRFYPLVSQEECIHQETKSFLHKVYGDSFQLLLTHFVREESLSAQEIQELRHLLDEKLQ